MYVEPKDMGCETSLTLRGNELSKRLDSDECSGNHQISYPGLTLTCIQTQPTAMTTLTIAILFP